MSKSVYPPAIANLIEAFRNQALCRRNEANQHEAKKMWKALYHLLNEQETREINIEWHHYLMGELETEDFGDILKRIEAKYRSI